eukprot:CAMPEP_0119356542 /NCGR_PEP_ID=MMETSP1334-20130426/5132_1 /TAXON_ID=127549 /ORGANISM="Calcidiscus leptoporus, Strain RCC1130" /LENGTH=443 /DNA_ID=CAMNT_0007370603 /DNA_START=119 /DNA_END=1452 /DNA_ORIENTATION=+
MASIRAAVERDYAAYATGDGDGCRNYAEQVRGWGYTEAVLAKYGLSTADKENLFAAACGGGCPLLIDSTPPRAGDTVVDLGCGAGHDLILAARMVGRGGCVIGVDLTQPMLDRASANVKRHLPAEHAAVVELRRGCLDNGTALDGVVPEALADVVISNGVFNLTADKEAAISVGLPDPQARRALPPVRRRADGAGGAGVRNAVLPPQECCPAANADGGGAGHGDDDEVRWRWLVGLSDGVRAVDVYLSLLAKVGFEAVLCSGPTNFCTSPTTQGFDFVGVKPRKWTVSKRLPFLTAASVFLLLLALVAIDEVCAGPQAEGLLGSACSMQLNAEQEPLSAHMKGSADEWGTWAHVCGRGDDEIVNQVAVWPPDGLRGISAPPAALRLPTHFALGRDWSRVLPAPARGEPGCARASATGEHGRGVGTPLSSGVRFVPITYTHPKC